MSADENITSIFKSFRFSSFDETSFNSNIEKLASNDETEQPEFIIDTNESSNDESEQQEVIDTNEPEQPEVIDINESSNNLKASVKPVIKDIINDCDNSSKLFLIIVFNIEEINNISKTLAVFNSIYDTVYLHPSHSDQCKWSTVTKYLNENESWKNYNFIWIPDCNINISNDNIVNFLQITESLNQDITQPSLKKSSDASIYTHEVLLNQANSKSRNTSFIENKIPCFKVDYIQNNLLPFLNVNSKYITSGWGIDLWWSNNSKQLSIIDVIEVEDSTLPINKSIGSKEMKYLIKKYKLKLSILIKK